MGSISSRRKGQNEQQNRTKNRTEHFIGALDPKALTDCAGIIFGIIHYEHNFQRLPETVTYWPFNQFSVAQDQCYNQLLYQNLC